MNTLLHNAKLVLKDKWLFIVTISICIGLTWFAYGCQPKTQSLIHPTEKVTRAGLQHELNTLIALAELRGEDLEKQEQFRNFVFQQALVIAETGTVNPFGVITSLLALLGIGATADDIRLRKERAKQPYVVPK